MAKQPKKWKVEFLYYVYHKKQLQKFETEVWSMQEGRAAVVGAMKLGQAAPDATVIRAVKVKEVIETEKVAKCYKCGRQLDPEGDDCCGKHQMIVDGKLVTSGYN